MPRWTLARRLTAGFGSVLLITLVLGAFAWNQFRAVQQHVRNIVVDDLPGVYSIGRAEAIIQSNYAKTLGAVMATTPARRAELEALIAADSSGLTAAYKAYEASITTAEGRRLFDAAQPLRAEYRRTRDDALTLANDGRQADAVQALETVVRPSLDRYIAAIEAVVDFNKRQADTEAPALEAAVSRGQGGLAIGLLLAFLLGGGVSLALVRSVGRLIETAVTELRTGSLQVASAASQVAGSAQSASQGASEQAASIEETSASMEEMSSLVRQNADHAERCAAMTVEAGGVLQRANTALDAMTTSIAEIHESSGHIARIIKTIDEIAFQTNLLALNAAVEAARAGEAGMGFSVVAGEVRALAQRSAQAAHDTAALIEESIARAGDGEARVRQVAQCMAEVTDSAMSVRGLVDEMSAATRQQAQGIVQVSRAVAQMEKVTQSAATTAEECAAASEELSAQAENVLIVVRGLAELAGLESGTAPADTADRLVSARVPRDPVVDSSFPAATLT